jgi:hypothetical protein
MYVCTVCSVCDVCIGFNSSSNEQARIDKTLIRSEYHKTSFLGWWGNYDRASNVDGELLGELALSARRRSHVSGSRSCAGISSA